MPRIWITDGSPVPFDDSYKLEATHSGMLGLRSHYKGLVDPAVPVGSATINGERADDMFYAEAEWCLSFPDGMEKYRVHPEQVDVTTPVVLQGCIEGKWLNRLLGTRAWAPATLGNNLLAHGPGIVTTIGGIEDGAQGSIEISYQCKRGGRDAVQVQRSILADLRGQNILGLVHDVLHLCNEIGQEVDWIDFGAMGEAAAVVNEQRRIREAMRLGVLPIPNPWYLLARHRLMERVVRRILAEGGSALPGTSISLTTRNGQGAVVGEGHLTWHAVLGSGTTKSAS
jgi:hypothetical protein